MKFLLTFLLALGVISAQTFNGTVISSYNSTSHPQDAIDQGWAYSDVNNVLDLTACGGNLLQILKQGQDDHSASVTRNIPTHTQLSVDYNLICAMVSEDADADVLFKVDDQVIVSHNVQLAQQSPIGMRNCDNQDIGGFNYQRFEVRDQIINHSADSVEIKFETNAKANQLQQVCILGDLVVKHNGEGNGNGNGGNGGNGGAVGGIGLLLSLLLLLIIGLLNGGQQA